jgi:uncharacterized membrane protein YfcA
VSRLPLRRCRVFWAATRRRRDAGVPDSVLRIPMSVYLPIAGVSMDVLLLIGLGAMVGVVSGMFGVAGGFLLTPLLVMVGVPPPVAVGTVINQVVGASVSAAFTQWRRGNVDVMMALVLVLGGLAGSAAGVWLFSVLRQIGQIDVFLRLAYVTLLGTLGSLMVIESFRSWLRQRNPLRARRKLHAHTWIHGLPFKVKFRASRLYISIFAPVVIGFVVGALSGLMGVGGGFVIMPALIYLLNMPTTMAVGTSLMQITLISVNVTMLQAIGNQTVDVILAIILVIGGAAGAQLGTRFGSYLRGEHLRGLLGLIVLAVGIEVAFELMVTPVETFSVAP